MEISGKLQIWRLGPNVRPEEKRADDKSVSPERTQDEEGKE
jgi:hypothetical protein